MKKNWKRIDIEFNEDDEIVNAEVDGEATEEFNKNEKSEK